MKRIFLTVLVLLIVIPAPAIYSQQCEIEYTWVEGTFPAQSEHSDEVTVQPGQNQTVNQMHITQIVNNGRNDAIIRTRSNSNDAVADYHTINNGSQTLWFPPTPIFQGTRLDRVSCLPYATIHDTEDLISEFGGSAQNLINDAQSAAQQGAEDARDDMIGLVNVANYTTFQQQAEQSLQEMEQQWEDLQQLAAENTDIGELILSEHFPELYEAIQATGSLNVNIPAAALQTHDQNLENLRAKLQDMDNTYQVSANINAFTEIDLEAQFPEIFAIEGYQCSLDTGLYDQFDGEFNRLISLFEQIMAEITPEADLPVFRFTRDEINQLSGLLLKPPCLEELVKANQVIAEDLNEFLEFVTAVQDNLRDWDVRWFARGNEPVYEDSRRLLESSERLIQLLVRQRQLEQATTQAKEEMDESYENLERGYGRVHDGDVFVLAGNLVDHMINPRDTEQIEQDLEDHQAAIERYESSLNARERGWQNIRRTSADWAAEAASLASAVSRLRLNITLITDFNGLMNNPVELQFPSESLRLAQSCITTANKSIATVINTFGNAFERYFADLQAMMQLMIPDELYVALEMHFEMITGIRANLEAAGNLPLRAAALGESYGLLTVAYADLGQSLAENPTDPDYLPKVESRIDVLSDRAEQLTSERTNFNQTFADANPDITLLLNTVLELQASLGNKENELPPLVAKLFETTLSIESVLNGLDSRTQSINECVTGKLDLTKNAVTSFPQRSQAFIDLIAEMTLDTVPEEVKESISNLLQLTNDQISNYADLRSWEVIEEEITNEQTLVMATAFAPLDFVEFHNEFLLALLPVPQPDAMPKLEILVQSFDDLVIETEELRSVIEKIIETDQQAAQEIQALAVWARTQASEMQNDLAELQLIAFDGTPIVSEINQMQDVASLWAVAAIETPGRLEELTISEIAQQLEELSPQVEQALQNLTSQTTAAISCAADAIQERSQIAGQSLNTAASQATADINSAANSVFNDLQNLLNPTSNLLSSVQGVITAGQTLMQDVEQSAVAGQSSFENLVSSSLQQMQENISCVDSTWGMIQQSKNELIGYYNEILDESHSNQMQIIQGSINFDPNN